MLWSGAVLDLCPRREPTVPVTVTPALCAQHSGSGGAGFARSLPRIQSSTCRALCTLNGGLETQTPEFPRGKKTMSEALVFLPVLSGRT